MSTIRQSKLNLLLGTWPPGAPRSADDLRLAGISADLAVRYVRSGWLERLARGVYRRPSDTLVLGPSLRLLAQKFPGLRVGGVTALDWHGLRHYVSPRPELNLYGWAAGPLPTWFTNAFPNRYHRLRLFDEQPSDPLRVQPFGTSDGAPTSEAERALLEMLSEVGVRQTLGGAREIMEAAGALRHEVLVELLKRCTSVKTVRLCLKLADDLELPWRTKLLRSRLPTGSAQRWVSRGKGGTLILPP